MADKKKPRTAGTGTASNTAFDSCNHIKSDPLIGWFNLTKPSRNHLQKRGWQRDKQQGQIDANMAGQLALLAVIVILFASGVTP